MELAKKVIGAELELFEKHFKDAVKSRVSLLDRIMQYIVKRKGKQMRPMFVLLSAKLHGEINDSSYRAASLVELLHTATLVHDDVVDDSDRRRDFFSINALWKNKIAVLVGDFLLSKGLLLCIDNNDFDLLKIISVAVREMSEGELLQIEKASLEKKGEQITIEKETELFHKIKDKYDEQTSPYYAAARLWTDAIIDPLETRTWINLGIEAANHAPIKKDFNLGVIQV